MGVVSPGDSWIDTAFDVPVELEGARRGPPTLRGLGDLTFRENIDALPAQLQSEVTNLAEQQLSHLVTPLVRLWAAKQRVKNFTHLRRQSYGTGDTHAERCVQAMHTSDLLEQWPRESLIHLANTGGVVSRRAGEVVLHQGENHVSGIHVLLEGTVDMTQKVVEKKSSDNAPPTPVVRHLKRLDAPLVLNDYAQLTEEPRLTAITSFTNTDWLIVPQPAFLAELERLSDDLRKEVYHMAFTRRLANMVSLFPITPERVRGSILFPNLTDTECAAVLARLQPRCYRKGQTLLRAKSKAKEIFFLHRGEVDLLGATTATLSPGHSFGELSVIFSERCTVTIRARTHCDVWVLGQDDLQVLCDDPAIHQKVRKAATRFRLKWLEGQATGDTKLSQSLLVATQKCPVLADHCGPDCLSEITAALRPVVYAPQDIIASSTEPCEGLVVLTRGKAVVQNQSGECLPSVRHALHPFEMVGYTCLADHRWLCAISAVDNCDVFTLPKADLAAILHRHACYDAVLEMSNDLVTNPAALLPTSQATPILFPTAHNGRRKSLWNTARRSSAATSRSSVSSVDSAQPSPPLPQTHPTKRRVSLTRSEQLMARMQRISSVAGRLQTLYRHQSMADWEKLQRKLDNSLTRLERATVQRKVTPYTGTSAVPTKRIIVCADGTLPLSRQLCTTKGVAPQCLVRDIARRSEMERQLGEQAERRIRQIEEKLWRELRLQPLDDGTATKESERESTLLSPTQYGSFMGIQKVHSRTFTRSAARRASFAADLFPEDDLDETDGGRTHPMSSDSVAQLIHQSSGISATSAGVERQPSELSHVGLPKTFPPSPPPLPLPSDPSTSAPTNHSTPSPSPTPSSSPSDAPAKSPAILPLPSPSLLPLPKWHRLHNRRANPRLTLAHPKRRRQVKCSYPPKGDLAWSSGIGMMVGTSPFPAPRDLSLYVTTNHKCTWSLVGVTVNSIPHLRDSLSASFSGGREICTSIQRYTKGGLQELTSLDELSNGSRLHITLRMAPHPQPGTAVHRVAFREPTLNLSIPLQSAE